MSNLRFSSSAAGRFHGDWKFAAVLGQQLAWPAGAFSAKISGLAVPINHILAGHAQTGTEIYHGVFRFRGKEAHSHGAMIFDVPISNLSWLEELHGFAWLIHLEASGLELGRVHARALIWDWLERKRYRQRGAGRLPVVCRRLKSWIFAAPFLLQGADEKFRSEFCAGLSRHLRDLQLRSALPLSSALRLESATALAFAAVALKGLEPLRTEALQLLADRLDAQILPDGGHACRSPTELVGILMDLLPLRQACEKARIELPAELHAALERMLPMLRFFIHGDGGLAIFQGASDPLIRECRAILDADAVNGRPLSIALYSRYARLSHESSTVICDIGLPAGEALSSHGATSPLAFEFSDAACRIVVNCGTPAFDDRLSAAAKLIEAHSTATLATARGEPDRRALLPKLGFVRPAPDTVEAQVDTTGLGSLLEAWHSLFETETGYLHERRLFLSATGGDFRGEDRFIPTGGATSAETSFVIRFHLHPAIKATLSLGGTSIVLLLTNGAGWTFAARNAHIGLQESICLWGKSGPCKTTQIVLSGHPCGETVNWAFKRCRSRPSPADDPAAPPTLPL
jgi:uncharacterized heparinase superfamily protein